MNLSYVIKDIFAFIEKHWKLILLALGALVIVGVVNEIFSCSINSHLNTDIKSLQSNNAILAANNNSQRADIAGLEQQIGQSASLVAGLQQQNQRLASSLKLSQSTNAELAKQLNNSTGFISTIKSDDNTASGLVGQVSGDIKSALGQDRPADSIDKNQ